MSASADKMFLINDKYYDSIVSVCWETDKKSCGKKLQKLFNKIDKHYFLFQNSFYKLVTFQNSPTQVSIFFFSGNLRANLTFNKPMPMDCQLMVLAEYTGTMTLNKDKTIELSYRAIWGKLNWFQTKTFLKARRVNLQLKKQFNFFTV